MHPAWRVILLIAAGLCLGAAARGLGRGWFADEDGDRVASDEQPAQFWFNVGCLALMGLYLGAVSLGFLSSDTGSNPW